MKIFLMYLPIFIIPDYLPISFTKGTAYAKKSMCGQKPQQRFFDGRQRSLASSVSKKRVAACMELGIC